MKNLNAQEKRTGRGFLIDAIAIALAVLYMFTLLQPVLADTVEPPPVPVKIQAPAGSTAFLVGHARGTQNYICLPTATGVAFTLFTPEATLFDDGDEQVITHFFSPNPAEKGTIRATWLDSRDTSTVWAAVVKPEHSSSDPNFVEPGAIPWLLLTKVGVQEGPTGGDRLTKTIAIQRLNTHGGLAPSKGCASSTDVGNKEFVPYTADYFFFR